MFALLVVGLSSDTLFGVITDRISSVDVRSVGSYEAKMIFEPKSSLFASVTYHISPAQLYQLFWD